jgi:hypothetical protein
VAWDGGEIQPGRIVAATERCRIPEQAPPRNRAHGGANAPTPTSHATRARGERFAFPGMRSVIAAAATAAILLVGFAGAPLLPVAAGALLACGASWWRMRAARAG